MSDLPLKDTIPQPTVTHRVFGNTESRRLIRQNFRDKAAFKAAGHRYMLHPVTLFTYVYPSTTVLLGMLPDEYAYLGLHTLESRALTLSKVLVYWMISYATLGWFAWVMVRRGLPFVLVPMAMWLIAVVVSQVAPVFVVPGFDWNPWRIMRQGLLIVPSTFVAVYATAAIMREGLGHIPDLVPIWTFNPKVGVPLLLKLPADRRGPIRRIHAANQYVEVVTDAGTTLLRISLRDAVALVPADMGWLCHRSLWINRTEVAALTHVRGQPRIIDRHGQEFPISRSSVSEIRDWLDDDAIAI